MPAAAVIPALIAYIKVVVVKKLVVKINRGIPEYCREICRRDVSIYHLIASAFYS